MSERRIRWITLLLVGSLGLYCIGRVEMTNSIVHFIPDRSEAELVDLSIKLVESPLARRMLVSVSGGPESRQVAQALRDELREHPEVTWVQEELDQRAMQEIYELYFERRVYMVSHDPAVEIPSLLEPESLAERARQLRTRLGQPGSWLLSRAAPADPLLLFERILERIREARPQAAGASAESQNENYRVFMIGLRSAPLDSEPQAQLLDYIATEFSRLNDLHGGGLVLEQSGVNRFAVSTEKSVREDANRISLAVIAAVCALFVLIFRSVRQLAIAILTPMAGFGAAMALAVSSAGRVHGITLAFGFVLIGVAIDYSIHVMSHHALASPRISPREVVRRIRPSLLLSAFTTTLAFLALAWSDFPGLSEMGTFAAIGVPISLVVTLASIPAFLPARGSPTVVLLGIARGFDSLVTWLEQRSWIAVVLCALGGGVAITGVPQLRWQDDPSALMALDPQLAAESKRVRERIEDFDDGRFVVALANSPEAALALNDQIAERLNRVIAAGSLKAIGSLHSFLWSEALQRDNLAALRGLPELSDRIDSAYAAQGFRPGSFNDFAAAVAEPSAAPLRAADLAGTPLERIADSLVDLNERWAAITYLRGNQSPQLVREALTGLQNVHYIDQREILAGVYEGYRRSTVRAILAGSILVLLVLQFRYRSITRGLLAFIPPGLAALATLGLFGLLGTPVSVVSAISLLVVLGMGVDYGIFAVDTARRQDRPGATLSSLLISCLTSTFVFGLLGFASQPVLRSIGITTATGILLAFLLSPAALVLAARTRDRTKEIM